MSGTFDPRFTPDQERFRAEVRQWLVDHAPEEGPPSTEAGQVAFLRQWQGKLAAARLVAPNWPEAVGGRGASWTESFIVQEEMARARVPEIINRIAVNLIGPSLLAHGNPAQKDRYLSKILSAEEIWCQLYSEPDAGSDLHSLRSTAEKVDGGWEVTGQKVWSSWADHADLGVLLARTEAATGRPGAIGYFIINMRQPGITARPLRQLTGEQTFCEVFLDRAFVRDEDVVGDPANGWRVMHTSIGYERSISPRQLITHSNLLEELLDEARQMPLTALQRQRLAQSYIELRIYRFQLYRVLTDLEAGREPSAESSLVKLFWSEMAQRMHELSMDLMGPAAVAIPTARQRSFLYYRACTIFAGTSEIQRNTLADRVLGLPREPRPAKPAPTAPAASTLTSAGADGRV